jgi:8-oxo-dGTP pyrophosphatase MutT (NUDIX family)
VKHVKPIKHYTASAFVFSDSLPVKVLLVHHKKYDKWMQPGGHQEEYENPVEAAIREVREETGIDATPYIGAINPIDDTASFIPRPDYLLECIIPAHGKEPQHYHIEQSYIIRLPEQPPRLSERESHDVKWFTLEELDGIPMLSNVRMIAKQEMNRWK